MVLLDATLTCREKTAAQAAGAAGAVQEQETLLEQETLRQQTRLKEIMAGLVQPPFQIMEVGVVEVHLLLVRLEQEMPEAMAARELPLAFLAHRSLMLAVGAALLILPLLQQVLAAQEAAAQEMFAQEMEQQERLIQVAAVALAAQIMQQAAQAAPAL